MITVTLSYSPVSLLFPPVERLFPVGKVGIIVVYPDSIVGVWGRRPGGWVNKLAGDPILERGLLRPLPPQARAAAEVFNRLKASVVGPITEALALPRLMVRLPEGFDPADANQEALSRFAGSEEGGAMLSAFAESMVRGPGGLFVPREFIPGPVALEDVFEDVAGLVNEDGSARFQRATLREIRSAGLARLAFTKAAIPRRKTAGV